MHQQPFCSYLPFSLNLRIGTLARISCVLSIYAMIKTNTMRFMVDFFPASLSLKYFFKWLNSST